MCPKHQTEELMSAIADYQIREMAKSIDLIKPFSERVDGLGIISYGLQPAGYDVRLDPAIKIFDWARGQGRELDPLNIDPDLYFDKVADPYFIMPPHSFVLGLSLEYFRIPRTISVRGVGKTTYTSVGINIHVAGIHPGWEGRLRFHISNPTPVPIRLYGNMGIILLEFSPVHGRVERDYGELNYPRFHKAADAFPDNI